jgi:hypothetical protein
MNLPKEYAVLGQIIGEQLSSVEFVQDYFQLRFDMPTINVTSNHTIVKAAGAESTSWDDKFRNMICGQIRKIVRDAALEDGQELKIIFEDESEIIVSLRPQDQSSPEAIYFHGFKQGEWGAA